MKKITMFFLGLLLFVPLSAFAVEKGADKAPPIEQTLVREGDFALSLADTLNLAKTDNEMDAERALASARIAPKNGWISDFPVTPDVLAEIRASVADAADGGRIKMDKKTAGDRFYALCKDMELPISTGNDTAAAERNKGYITGEEYGTPADYQDEAVINNYYYEEGPPVITYYPPPPDYFYLYAWDPYPFWWGGYWFPGYYVLNDFTIVIDGHHHHHHRDGHRHRDGDHDRGGVVSDRTGKDTKIISNRVVDSGSNKVTTLDPVTRNVRTGGDSSRSGRASNIARFGNTDTRRGAENILKNSIARERGSGAPGVGGSGFVRRENQPVRGPSTGAYRRDSTPNTTRSFDPAPSLRGRSSDVGRSFDPAPSLRGRSNEMGRGSYGGARQFAPASRSMSGSPGSGGRSFSAPRSYSPAPSGGSGGFRSPGSGGGFNRGFGGGGCRGGRC